MELIKKIATQTYEVKSENYTLTATAQYEIGKGVNSINGGVVRKDEKHLAAFSRNFANDHYMQNLSVSFADVTEDEQKIILSAIHAFVAAIKADINA